MMKPEDRWPLKDNGGMREVEDRRQENRSVDFSDRRSRHDRRKGSDRRSGIDRRSPDGFRAMLRKDRRLAWGDARL